MNNVPTSTSLEGAYCKFPKFNHLPELEITRLENISSKCSQNNVEEAKKKSKMPKEQMDIHELLLKLPVLFECFNIHKKIGEGTYSSVYLATYKKSDGCKRFAVKHLTQNVNLQRILNELKFMQVIGGKDNVVSLLNYLKNDNDDCFAFIMPYLEHRRFSEYVLHMDADELRIYMKNLFIALRRVHAHNVIHRDVKPGNFLYNRETKEFMLVDFGLAQIIGNGSKEKRNSCEGDGENMPIDYSKRKRSPSDDGNQAFKKTIISPLKSRENILGNSGPNKGGRIADLTSPIVSPVFRANVEMTPLKSRSHTSSLSSSSRKKLFGDDSHTTVCNPINCSTRRESSLGTCLLKSKTENKFNSNDSSSKDQRSFMPLVANKTHSGSFVQVRNSQVVAQKYGGCLCAGVGLICGTCQNKRALTAPRAGTPGFRPPEVLLKYMHQTTAVDMWAAGVIMLCVLSGCYPFFKSPSDLSALVEIITIFGKDAVEKVANKFGRRVTCSVNKKPIDLRKLCRKMRARRTISTPRVPENAVRCEECQQFIRGSECLCQLDNVAPVNSCSDGDTFPDSAYHLLLRLLDVDPTTRITAGEALNHPFINQH